MCILRAGHNHCLLFLCVYLRNSTLGSISLGFKSLGLHPLRYAPLPEPLKESMCLIHIHCWAGSGTDGRRLPVCFCSVRKSSSGSLNCEPIVLTTAQHSTVSHSNNKMAEHKPHIIQGTHSLLLLVGQTYVQGA